MDLHKYFDPNNQGAMRKWLQEIAIREKLGLVDLARMAGVTPLSIRRFIFGGQKAGPKVILGVAHILDKYNDKYKELS